MVLLLLLLLILLLGLDRYRYAASADTGQYWSVLVSANTYLSIDANISSPVVRLPVSTVNTVATHAYSFKPIPYFHASTLHTYLTCTHLYPAQNRIFSMKNLYTPVSVSVQLWPIVSGIRYQAPARYRSNPNYYCYCYYYCLFSCLTSLFCLKQQVNRCAKLQLSKLKYVTGKLLENLSR